MCTTVMETMESSSPSFSPSIETGFEMTPAGFIVPSLTGILSACCSILILYAIYKSPVKLSSTYHRIMAMMSIFDLLASVCIALTTLPMPTNDILRFAGPMLGNHLTCQIQGYIIAFGLSGGVSLDMCLGWYFVCRMTLMMDSYTIMKRIEPVFFLISFGVAIFLPSYYLCKGLINTVPGYQFCFISRIHSNCNYSNEKVFHKCNHQGPEFEQSPDIMLYLVGCNAGIIVVTMSIIIWTITKKKKTIKRVLEIRSASENSSTSSEDELKISELRYTRVLVVQALMYVFAYLITWVFMVIPMVAKVDHDSLNIIRVFKSIFLPLQGFWNLIIFIYDKADLIYHDEDEYQSYWEKVKIVLFHPDKAPEIILPDSLQIERQNNTAGDRNNEETRDAGRRASSLSLVRGSIAVNIVENIEQSMKSDYSSTSSSNKVIHRDGIEYLGEENRRFYLDSNGLRRTGQIEDRRHGRVEFYTTSSIESPGGFVSNSNGSDVLSVTEEQS